MDYLTLYHQLFTFMPNPPLPHHANSIPCPLLSLRRSVKAVLSKRSKEPW